MDSKLITISVVVILCALSFATGKYYGAQHAQQMLSDEKDLAVSASELSIPATPNNLLGSIESIGQGEFTLKTFSPIQHNRTVRVLVNSDTLIFLSVPSTNQSHIDELEKNLPSGVPMPQLYEQVQGSMSDLRRGDVVTLYAQENVLSQDQLTATRIVVSARQS